MDESFLLGTRSRRSSQFEDDVVVPFFGVQDKQETPCTRYIRDNNEEFVRTDSFQRKVKETTQRMSISQKEAELVLVTDTLIEENGTVDAALLYVVSNVTSESRALPLVDNLIRRGANVSTSDGYSNPLSYSVAGSFIGVAAKLLKQYDEEDLKARIANRALTNAIESKQDDMSALIISHMPKSQLFRYDSVMIDLKEKYVTGLTPILFVKYHGPY